MILVCEYLLRLSMEYGHLRRVVRRLKLTPHRVSDSRLHFGLYHPPSILPTRVVHVTRDRMYGFDQDVNIRTTSEIALVRAALPVSSWCPTRTMIFLGTSLIVKRLAIFGSDFPMTL